MDTAIYVLPPNSQLPHVMIPLESGVFLYHPKKCFCPPFKRCVSFFLFFWKPCSAAPSQNLLWHCQSFSILLCSGHWWSLACGTLQGSSCPDTLISSSCLTLNITYTHGSNSPILELQSLVMRKRQCPGLSTPKFNNYKIGWNNIYIYDYIYMIYIYFIYIWFLHIHI